MELRELLQLSTLKDATILAGSRGIDRKVSSVNIMDAPDIAKFVQPEQLLLTNAFAIKDTPSELIRIIDRMTSNQGAGIFIKTKRFLQEIPTDVLRRANELDFPIVELRMQYSLGEVLQQTMGFILEKQAEEFRYALQLHKQFSETMMKGGGLPQLIETLASMIGCHVLIADERSEIAILSKSLKTVKHEPVARRVMDLIRQSGTGDGLAPGPSCLWLESAPQPFEISFHPIETFTRQGFLVFLHSARKTFAHNVFNQLAVEQAVNVIEFEWMKRHAVKERSRRFKYEFFSDLVEGLLTSEEEISHRGKKYDALHQPPLCIVAAKIDASSEEAAPAGTEGAAPYATRELIYDRIKRRMETSGFPYVRFMKNETFCILISVKHLSPPLVNIEESLRELQAELYDRRRISVSFGIGTPVESIAKLSVSYKEAMDALKAGYQRQSQRFIESYKAKQTEDLLRLLPMDVMRSYYSSTFNRLLEADEKERAELQKTIQTYLEQQSSISDTSKKMFIHRNTVIYRLHKYERLTGRNLHDPDDTLRIRLALIMEALIEPESPRGTNSGTVRSHPPSTGT